MLRELLKPQALGSPFTEIADAVRQGIPSAVFNLSFSEKCHVASMLDRPVLFVVPDTLAMERAAEEVRGLSGRRAVKLYPKDDVLLDKRAFSKFSLFKRIAALCELKAGADFAIATPESLMQLFPADVRTLTLKKGGSYDLKKIASALASMGYQRGDFLEGQGSFALRGDILDLFPVGEENPWRIDFFGDEVETLKRIDGDTREGLGYADALTVFPATDVLIGAEEIPALTAELRAEMRRHKNADAAARVRVRAQELIDALESGAAADFGALMPLLVNTTADIFDYLPAETAVVFDEPKRLSEAFDRLVKEHTERYAGMAERGEAFTFAARQYADKNEVLGALSARRALAVQTLTTAVPFFSPLKTFSVRSSALPRYRMKLDILKEDLGNWTFNGYRAVVCTGNYERAAALSGELSDEGIPSCIDRPETKKGVLLLTEELDSGLLYHDAKLVVVGSGDIYARKEAKKRIRKSRSEFFSAPEVGDIAVHEVHGIGIVRGTKRISTSYGTKDYIAVEYAGGDILYVPVEQMDVLSRYLGGDKKPALSRIGGKDFERAKQKAKESIRKMSFDLKELYRLRAERKGFCFEEDASLQAAFEDAFEFDPTDDQLRSADEIRSDMCSEKVMDRLLCGDVGFGKTEVAFRAAFRAIVNHKQVALLAPTTILSQQHYNTAVRRFADFGVEIAVVNRFKTDAQQAEILARLKEGKIDLIVGTHRLLSADVGFRDLGLLILDEEQRFGVEHKEKIKLLKNNVDTLTMTATPIPRTLHMSLAGIRDISTINTPPRERIPVQTYVTEETEGLIRDALIRELSRGGQAFILYNRVESIYSFAKKVKDIVPEAGITVVHGQMEEKKLERHIEEFYAGKTDVLISTTIIENGVDLPRANTLVVIDADRLGLSTLYQLKGRVGRSNRMAHAYFTFKRDKVLNEAAYKRLTAIMEFTEMGSGFRIAMRDLEIRGAGNVLGKEQHGHMDKVGYELYSKLLKEELGEKPAKNVQLDIRVSAYIPEGYIENSAGRMDAYKEIAEIRTLADRNRVVGALEDLYGELPLEVENLVEIASVKAMAEEIGVEEVLSDKGTASLVFDSIERFGNLLLHDAMDRYRGYVKATAAVRPTLEFSAPEKDAGEMLALLKDFLAIPSSFAKKSEKK
jgi:transcription-repair coupling factor